MNPIEKLNRVETLENIFNKATKKYVAQVVDYDDNGMVTIAVGLHFAISRLYVVTRVKFVDNQPVADSLDDVDFSQNVSNFHYDSLMVDSHGDFITNPEQFTRRVETWVEETNAKTEAKRRHPAFK